MSASEAKTRGESETDDEMVKRIIPDTERRRVSTLVAGRANKYGRRVAGGTVQ